MIKVEQDIEHGRHIGQSGRDIVGNTMAQPFQVADNGDHRQSGFYKHTLVPGAFLAEFEVVGNTVWTAEAEVSKDETGLSHGFSDGMKMLVMRYLFTLDSKNGKLRRV